MSVGARLNRKPCDDGRRDNEPMREVVRHDTETLQGPYAQQSHVARLCEHHLVVGFVAFGGQDRVTDLSFNLLLRGGREGSLPARGDSYPAQNIRRKPGQLRSSIHLRFQWRGGQFFPLGIARDDVDLENAHGSKIIPCLRTRKQRKLPYVR